MPRSENSRPLEGVLFLTCPVDYGRRLLPAVLERFPKHRWTVYLRDAHRESLAPLLEGLEVHRDKPAGSRIAFLLGIRRRRYDVAVSAWQGDPAHNRMKLVMVLSGARLKIAYNDNLNGFTLRLDADPVWLRHIKWRLSTPGLRRSMMPFRSLVRLYTWTFGLLFGSLRIWWDFMRYQARRHASGR